MPLLASSLLSELASNVVFVYLLEKAFELSDLTASVSAVLIVQSASQLVLGTFAGSVVDKLGSRRAVTLGLIGQAVFTFGLALSRSIGLVFVLAGLVTFARLLVTPSRLVLLRSLSSRPNLPRNNSLFSAVTGLSLFFGPAIAAWLFVLFTDSSMSAWIAGIMLIISVIVSRIGPDPNLASGPASRPTLAAQMRTAWHFVVNNRPVWQPLICLMNSVMITAAMVPLLTPFARQLNMGPEGTGILIAAYGLGTLAGPFMANWSFTRVSLSRLFFWTGLATPLSILALGFMKSFLGVLAALMIAGLAGAGLNMVVVTILQRLTPLDKRGFVLGAEQSLVGLGWVVSSFLITGLFSFGNLNIGLQDVFLAAGAAGTLMVLSCGFVNRNRLTALQILPKPNASNINGRRGDLAA